MARVLKKTETAAVSAEHDGAKILIAIPCMDMVPHQFAQSLLNLRKTSDTYYAFHANSLVYSSRNDFAANAIEKGYDRVLWLDSDMTFGPDLLERLNADMDEYGMGYVSALAFKRKLPTSPCVYELLTWVPGVAGNASATAKTYVDYPQDSLFPCAATGFGAVLVSTELMKAVWDRFGPPFNPMPNMGEDLSFCYRAGKLSRLLFCDSRVKCGHIGQYEYTERDYLMIRAMAEAEKRAGDNVNSDADGTAKSGNDNA